MLANNFTPRVSFVSGIVNSGDALSETILAELEALDRFSAANRQNIDARVYCASSSVSDSRVVPVSDWQEVLRYEHFLSSDLYFYHYGIVSPMHQTIAFTRRDAYVSAYFHNVTQPQYLARTAEDVIYKSYQQIELLRVATEHFAASEYSATQLRSYGLGRPVHVVPLFGPNGGSSHNRCPKSFAANKPIGLLYCGRFVPSKGVLELLEAVNKLDAILPAPLTLTLAGIEEHSDKAYLQQLETMADKCQAQVKVEFRLNLGAEDLGQLYSSSDGLVLPSYHEGFGMPVAEAYLHGVPVLCSNAGALPEIAGGLGLTFTAGKSQSIAEAIHRFVAAHLTGRVLTDSGELDQEDWSAKVAQYASQFDRETFIERATKRISEQMKHVSYRSNHYRSSLCAIVQNGCYRSHSDLIHSGHHDEAEAAKASGQILTDDSDRLEAALRGAMIGDAIKTNAGTGETALALALLEWPFREPQSDEDLQFWLSELRGRGLQNLTGYLAETTDVRASPARMAAGPYVKAAVNAIGPGKRMKEGPYTSAISERLTLDHPLIIMLLESPMSTADFIKELFRMVLLREHEDNGFGPYHDAIEGNTLSRVEMAMELFNSDEYRALNAAV